MDKEVVLLRKLEILSLIENFYSIEIKDEEIEFIKSMEDLLIIVQEKVAKMK